VYKAMGAPDFRRLLKVPDDYAVAGLLVHGCAANYPYDMLTAELATTFPERSSVLDQWDTG